MNVFAAKKDGAWTEVGPANSWVPFTRVTIGGLPIATASRAQLTEAMVKDCKSARELGHAGPARLIFDANGHALSLRKADGVFREALDQADLVHADGGFLVTISKLLTNAPIAERSATTDMLHDFAARASEEGLSFYLLGGNEAVNAECAQMLVTMYPGLKIAGRHHGYFSDEQANDVIAEINRIKPDVVWLGLGKPKEQTFAVRFREHIRAGWVVTCGGCFNYVTGHYRRAPQWMQDANLEWLHRMITNPRQLLWRYLTTTPHALFLSLTETRPEPIGSENTQ